MATSPDTMAEILDERPRRVTLIRNPGDINTREVYPVLLNPSTLREQIGVEWTKLGVIGLDHEVPHYARTKSIELPLSFYFSQYFAALEPRSQAALNRDAVITSDTPLSKIARSSMDFANFMRSLCFPTREGLRPPPLKIIWPNVLDLTGVVTSLSFEYRKFDRDLAPIIYQADITLLETRITRRFSEEVRQNGIQSDPDNSGSRKASVF
jgi:hypothetical protein